MNKSINGAEVSSLGQQQQQSYQLFDTFSILLGATTLFVVWFVHYNYKRFSYWTKQGIKGPTPWPLFGTGIYYMFRKKVDVDMEWSKKYGRTYGVYEGYAPMLRTSDNELIRFVWIKNFSSFTDRNSSYVFSDTMKLWPLWSKGNHWSTQRALMTPMFTSAKVKTIFNTALNCIQRLKQEISSRLSSEKLDCDTFSKDELLSATLDTIAQSFFGIKLENTYKDKQSDFYKRAFAISSFDVARSLVWILIPSFVAKRYQIDLIPYSKYEYFDKLSRKIIDERRKDGIKKKNDFIQALLDARIPQNKYENVYSEEDDREAHYNDQIDHKELEKINESQAKGATFKQFNDDEISGQMTFLFIAGFETTSSSLSACFFELAHQQDAQEELYEELLAYKRGEIGNGKDLIAAANDDSYSNLLSLKKLDAFISETLRLYANIIDLNRVVTVKEGVKLPTNPPISLPLGGVVTAGAFVIQRDPDYWPNPLKFDMSRFYPENRNSLKPCSYIPFGVGPRNCAGIRFALMVMKLCLSELLLEYQVLPGQKACKYPPEFTRHFFALQLEHTDFRLQKRQRQQQQ